MAEYLRIGEVAQAVLSPDERLVAARAHDWQVGVWDAVTGQLRHLFEAPRGAFHDNADLASGNVADDHAVVSVHWLYALESELRIEPNHLSDDIADFGQQLAPDFFDVGLFQAADLFDKRQRHGEHVFAAVDK